MLKIKYYDTTNLKLNNEDLTDGIGGQYGGYFYRNIKAFEIEEKYILLFYFFEDHLTNKKESKENEESFINDAENKGFKDICSIKNLYFSFIKKENELKNYMINEEKKLEIKIKNIANEYVEDNKNISINSFFYYFGLFY